MSNLKSSNYYEILGVPKNADDAALKKAYKKLAVKWHPDKNPGSKEATENFQKISEAYATLSDKRKRQIYDQYGEEGVNAADQMGENGPGGAGGGGMPHGFGFSPGGGGGGRTHHMSPEEAEQFFAQFFGGSDPFGGSPFGGGGSRMRSGRGPGIQFQSHGFSGGGGGGMRQDPLAAMFGGMGGMPGMGGMGGMQGMGGIPGMGGMHGMGGMPGMGGGHSGFGMGGQPQYSQKRYDAIPEGTVVSLKGLQSKPERNGDRGVVQGYNPSSGRYVVELEDTDETMSVKPSNLLQHVHVRLHGLESRPDLNGHQGTIIAWNANTERYNIYVASKVIALKPNNVVLENGTVGHINGLQSKPELNGKWGTIKNFHAAASRYDVQLSADKIIRVKMENIIV